ncbi:MAG: mechanosensitive ion channel family protein [Erysipelotrichales bacterium]|nr:mechanosensitive ion channel family protein [Erysipelotrichales bacterium]
MLENLKELFTNFSLDNPIIDKTIKLVILIVVMIICYILINYIAKKTIEINQKRRGIQGIKRAETLSKLTKSLVRYVSIPIFIIFALPIFGVEPASVFASAGLIGVIVGFAFQDLLKDIVAGFFIIFERTYEVDDYVKINNYTGVILSLGIKTTVIRNYNGEIYTMNNRDVGNVTNYSKAPYSIVVCALPIAYDTDLKKFKEILDSSFVDIEKKFPVIMEKPSIKGITSFDNSSLKFEIHIMVKSMEQFQFKRDFDQYLLEICNANKIKIPYQTITITKE